jgi:hypothetical protein
MSNNVLCYLVAGTLGVTLALVSPALAFHGGGGGMRTRSAMKPHV